MVQEDQLQIARIRFQKKVQDLNYLEFDSMGRVGTRESCRIRTSKLFNLSKSKEKISIISFLTLAGDQAGASDLFL